MRRRMMGARGQALPLLVVLMMLGLSLLVAAAHLAPVLDDAARARTAADAAALAGVVEGRTAAAAIAAANDGVLVEYERVGASVTVVVRVGVVSARARALMTGQWVSR